MVQLCHPLINWLIRWFDNPHEKNDSFPFFLCFFMKNKSLPYTICPATNLPCTHLAFNLEHETFKISR